MSKNLSVKYYQENKEKLQKKTTKKQKKRLVKIFLRKKKKKSGNMVLNVTKISHKIKKINWLSIVKNITQ